MVNRKNRTGAYSVLIWFLISPLFATSQSTEITNKWDAIASEQSQLDAHNNEISTGTPSSKINFSSEISLSATPGLLSYIRITPDNYTSISRIRLILTLDNKLLILPLRKVTSSKTFEGKLPTPSSSMYYQVQVVNTKGLHTLSEVFEITLDCSDNASAEKSLDDSQSTKHPELVEKITQHKNNTSLLTYITNSIDNIMDLDH